MGLPNPIGVIYTMDQACEALHCSRRFLQDLIKKHPYYADKGGRAGEAYINTPRGTQRFGNPSQHSFPTMNGAGTLDGSRAEMR